MNQKRRLRFWLVAIAIAIFALLGAFWLDPFVQRWMAIHQEEAIRAFMQKVSDFGDWPAHVIIGLLLWGLAWWRGNKQWTRIFLSMLIACALAGAAARVMKVAVGRARPSVQTEAAWSGPSLNSKHHAFPSGHVASSMAFFAVLFFVSRRIGLACLPIPILIGFSRMYVTAHYLSDVVFATILGLLCAFVTAHYVLKIDNLKSEIEN